MDCGDCAAVQCPCASHRRERASCHLSQSRCRTLPTPRSAAAAACRRAVCVAARLGRPRLTPAPSNPDTRRRFAPPKTTHGGRVPRPRRAPSSSRWVKQDDAAASPAACGWEIWTLVEPLRGDSVEPSAWHVLWCSCGSVVALFFVLTGLRGLWAQRAPSTTSFYSL